MFTYRSKAKWNNSVLFQLVISSLIWLPLSYLLVSFALKISDLKVTLLFFSILLVWALMLFNRAQMKIRFPAIEVSAEHLVLNRPMYNRTVYNLSEVEGAKFLGGSLCFRHLGWPVLTPLGSMPKEKRTELLNLLSAN